MITEEELKIITGMTFREFRTRITQVNDMDKITKYYLEKGGPVYLLEMTEEEFNDWKQQDILLTLEEAKKKLGNSNN